MAKSKSSVSPALRSAFKFFSEHAGYVVGEHAKSALELARAERAAKKKGVCFRWEPDEDADLSWMDEAQRKKNYDVEWVAAYRKSSCLRGEPHPRAIPCASVGGVVGADRNYRRVLEAELASECLATPARR